MAVLVEGISVVIRADALLRAYHDEWDRFVADVPNRTLCADGELARVGFMVTDSVRAFVALLERRGLVYLADGAAQDMVVVDQQRGPCVRCAWVEFGHVNLDNDPRKRVACCRISGSVLQTVVTPDGWDYHASLTSSHGFVPSESQKSSLRFLRRKDGLNVYLNEMTGREVFIAEPSAPGRIQ